MQEITLVLAGIDRFQQLKAAGIRAGRRLAHARIVACGDEVGAQLHGMVEEGFELDFGIAQHVGVGSATGLIFA